MMHAVRTLLLAGAVICTVVDKEPATEVWQDAPQRVVVRTVWELCRRDANRWLRVGRAMEADGSRRHIWLPGQPKTVWDSDWPEPLRGCQRFGGFPGGGN